MFYNMVKRNLRQCRKPALTQLQESYRILVRFDLLCPTLLATEKNQKYWRE